MSVSVTDVIWSVFSAANINEEGITSFVEDSATSPCIIGETCSEYMVLFFQQIPYICLVSEPLRWSSIHQAEIWKLFDVQSIHLLSYVLICFLMGAKCDFYSVMDVLPRETSEYPRNNFYGLCFNLLLVETILHP